MAVAAPGAMPRASLGGLVSAPLLLRVGGLLFVLTTFVFLRTWLLLGNGSQPYFLRRSPLFSLVIPVVASQIVIAVIAAALILLTARFGMRPAIRERLI